MEEARMLIERGANLKGPSLGNPLVIACGAGQAQMAVMLLDVGAELFETIMIDANTGQTMDIVLDRKKAKPVEFRFAQALYAAARSGTPETVDLLLARGADLNARLSCISPLRPAIPPRCDICSDWDWTLIKRKWSSPNLRCITPSGLANWRQRGLCWKAAAIPT